MLDQEAVERIKEAVLPFLQQQKIELVELSLRRHGNKTVLMFLVERSGGITLDDCVYLNQEISAILDKHSDILMESYVLEVSSPGLDRPLVTERDFIRALGKEIQVFLKESWEGKLEYQGLVVEVLGSKLWLKIGEERTIQIPLEFIHKGKQVIT